MASSINQVLLLGRLGRDPEVTYLQSGTCKCQFNLATTRPASKDSQDEHTEWHRIVLWGKVAENSGKYLEKGRQVLIQGSIQTRSYEKDGVKHYITEVIGRDVTFLGGGKRKDSAREEERGQRRPPESGQKSFSGGEDDIPF